MKILMKVLKALGDQNRIKILKMLEKRDMCVCEIREALRISQPGVSKHLKILEDAELVRSRKEGMWVNYSLNMDPGNPYSRDMVNRIKLWLTDEPEVQKLLDVLPTISKDRIMRGKDATGS